MSIPKQYVLRRSPDGVETIITGDLVAGRSPGCGLQLPENGRDTDAPRLSARLVVSSGVLWVEDLGSKNGTFVNGARLAAGNMSAPLKNGDRLRIETTEYTVIEKSMTAPGLAGVKLAPAAVAVPASSKPARPLETPPVSPSLAGAATVVDKKPPDPKSTSPLQPPRPNGVASGSSGTQAAEVQGSRAATGSNGRDSRRENGRDNARDASAPSPPAPPTTTVPLKPPDPKPVPVTPPSARLAGASPGISSTDLEGSRVSEAPNARDGSAREGGAITPARTTEVPDARGPMLRVLTGALAGRHFTLESPPGESASWRIGRHTNQDIILPHVSVSGEHARIVNQGGRWEIIDQLSRSGTFVNGRHVMRSALTSGDRLLIGAIQCSFEFAGQTLQGAARPRARRLIDVPALLISMAVTSTLVLILWRYLPELEASLQHLWGGTG